MIPDMGKTKQGIGSVRRKFINDYKRGNFVTDKSGCKLIELIGETFICDDDHIFGEVNHDYISREIAWYESQSRNVNDIPGKVPEIWKQVADKNGLINSNYGWCVFSEENHNQFKNVVDTLTKNPNSRQAVMIYTRPTMHEDAFEDGRSDFMCTKTVQYLIRDNKLTAIVQMRSNDVVFGFRNDYAWQKYVVDKLAAALDIEKSEIIWHVGSLHVYERHFNLIK